MSITFNESTRIFTLNTAHSTYQMQADMHDYLLHLYYGARTAGEMGYLLSYADRGFSGNPYSAEMEPILWMRCHRNILLLEPETSVILY